MGESKMWEATQWFILENYNKSERQWWTAYFRNGGLNPEILDRADEILRERAIEEAQEIQPHHKTELPKYTCKRCGGSWTARKNKKPVQCPKCKSPYWDKDRKK